MKQRSRLRQACTVLEHPEHSPVGNGEKPDVSEIMVDTTRAIAVLSFIVTSIVGLWLKPDVWQYAPFAACWVVSVLAVPIQEGLRALRRSDPDKMMKRFSELIDSVR